MQAEIVEVQFKGERRNLYLNSASIPLKVGDYVIVEVDRGEDLGKIVQRGELTRKKQERYDDPVGTIRRKATIEEQDKLASMNTRENEALKICHEKVQEHNLKMKLVDAEWQFDGNKISFYFTADKRVDFRQLVKDLASIFRTRIELKQIGVRDEARRLGGCGRCGCKLCCTTFLREFEPVTLRAAKDQRLSLNPSQISGLCGRLMCCLMYERGFYKSQLKKFPKEGKEVQLKENQSEKISGLDIFNETVEIRNREGYRRKIPLDEFKSIVGDFTCHSDCDSNDSENNDDYKNGNGDGQE